MNIHDLLSPKGTLYCQKKTVQLLTKLIKQELNEDEMICEIINARISEKNKMLDLGIIAQELNDTINSIYLRINELIKQKEKANKINSAIGKYLSVKIKEKGPVENELIKINFENIEKLTIANLAKEKEIIEKKASCKKPITKKRKK